MSLVCFTGLCGALLAPNRPSWILIAVYTILIAVGAGAAGAFHMWFERNLDGVMERTKNRPLPRGVIDPEEALALSIILSVLSVSLIFVLAGYIAAFALLASILFYAVIYTIWLKPRTPQNIVIGGAAGAAPPLIGWAAVTGEISLEAVALFGLIFIWTPPHFWALALAKMKDYENAAIPMLPNVKGAASTKRHIFAYSIALTFIAAAPWFLGLGGWAYLIASSLLSLRFCLLSVKLFSPKASDSDAMRLFGFSIFYLFALFLTLVVEHEILLRINT